MFGFVVASAPSLSDAEKARYQAVYCGLCHTLKTRYGQLSRAVLTYDLTFYVLLAQSLSEEVEQTGTTSCPAHPLKPQSFSRSRWTNYAADLSVALAYHKCLDDIADEGGARPHIAAAGLKRAYRKVAASIPSECRAIETALKTIASCENEGQSDGGSRVFGALLGALFTHNQNHWAWAMEAFGQALGRFIFLMDAAVDYRDDKKYGRFNPFVSLESSPEAMALTLRIAAADAAAAFEKLPLVQDIHLMESILYEGVWIQFNKTYPDLNGAKAWK